MFNYHRKMVSGWKLFETYHKAEVGSKKHLVPTVEREQAYHKNTLKTLRPGSHKEDAFY